MCYDYKSQIEKSNSPKVIYKHNGLLYPLPIGFELDASNPNG